MQELSVEEFRRRYGSIRASMSFGRTVKNGDFVYGVWKIKLVKPKDVAK